MSAVIEMHDSKCLAVELDEKNGGFVLLEAYIHRGRGDGDLLMSPHDGGVQRIRIKFEQMAKHGAVGNLPADIYEGSLIVGADVQDNIIHFPATYTGPVRLSMVLSDDARVVIISGSRLSIEAEGEFEFLEAVDFSSENGKD